MTSPAKLAALGVVALVASLLGCGGGSSPVSGPELIAKGDGICREGFQRFEEIQAQPATTVAEYADQTGKLADSAKAELDALRDLQPPAELATKYDAYLQAKQAGVDLLDRGRDAAEQQNGTLFGKLQKRVQATGLKRRELARAVGFKICSQEAADQPPG